MNLNALISILLARKISIIATTVAAIAAAIIVSLLTPKTYTAATDLLVDSRGVDPISGQSQPLRSTGAYLSTQADIIRSHNVASKVLSEVQLDSNATVIKEAKLTGDAEKDKRRIMGFLAKGLIVTPKRESSILTIAFESKDPALAAQLANAFAQAYMFTNLELRIEPAKQTSQWYDLQLEGLRTDLIKKQDALSNYQEKHNIIVSSDRLDLESAKLEELASVLIAVQTERLKAQSRSDQIANTKVGQMEARTLDDPQVQKLSNDLAQAQARLYDLATQVGENHPQYRQALSDVNSIKKQMNRQIELIGSGLKSSIELSQAREEQLKTELAHQKEMVLQLSRNRNEITLLRQEVDNAQAAYDAALARAAESRLESQIAAIDVAVLNSAMTPGRPTSPKPVMTTLLATIMGLLLGTAIALCREWLDQRIRSAQDLEQGLGLVVLAQIPADISGVYKEAKA